MKKIKKAFSLLLILVLLLTTLPTSASAQLSICIKLLRTGQTYLTIASALRAAQNGDTLLLLTDINASAKYEVTPDKIITIDGDGHKICDQDNGATENLFAGLHLQGTGTIRLKNITLQGGESHTRDHICKSYGIYVAGDVTIESEGTVTAIGANLIADLSMSVGVQNGGSKTVNITNAIGGTVTGSGVCSVGVTNGKGTVNVYSATGYDRGLLHMGSGTINVADIRSDNTAIMISNPSGIVNVTNAVGGLIGLKSIINSTSLNATHASGPLGACNTGPDGIMNVANLTGSIKGLVNTTSIAALNLVRGSGANCVLDSITVAATGPTTVGFLPSTYCDGVYSTKWYTDAAKTTEFTATTVTGATTLYGFFYNKISGKITADGTNAGLAASLQLKDSHGVNVGSPLTTNADGTYSFETALGTSYSIEVSTPGYLTASFPVSNGSTLTDKNLTLQPEPVVPSISPTPAILIQQLKLTNPVLTMVKGTTFTLKVNELLPSTATNQAVTWSSSNPAIVAVNETGKLTAKKAGVATITCTANDGSGAKATSTITITESTSSSVKVAWKKATNVSGYRVTLSHGSKKITKFTTKTSYLFTKLNTGTSYKVVVTPWTQKGSKQIFKKSIATITTATRPAKTKTSITSGHKAATIRWKRVSGASGYEILMSTKKSSGYQHIKTINKGNVVKYNKTKLTIGKTYYIRIRAYKTINGQNIYGNPSRVASVKVK